MSPSPAPATTPALARVLRDASARLERNGLQAVGRLRLARLTAAEVSELSGLLGPRWRAVLPGASTSVDLAMLDDALRASPRHGRGLAETCAAACGSALVDRRAVRISAAGLREHGWERLGEHPALVRHPDLGAWLEQERSSGTAVRSGGGDPFPLLRRALGVLAALPAEPPRTLARFAAAHCDGDPHALDRDRPLDRTVRRALAFLDGDVADGSAAQARRERYDRWGIGCDELSSTVLCLGVWPQAAQPRVLTLRELRGLEVLSCGQVLYTCENPDVVAAAADALGCACPPLVCTGGWPSTACARLLRAARAGGATTHHHGDMDPEGLRILDRLLATTGATLWRMDPTDYERHRGAGAPLTSSAAGRQPRDASLRRLAALMQASGRVVQEEQTVEDLLADLAEAVRIRTP